MNDIIPIGEHSLVAKKLKCGYFEDNVESPRHTCLNGENLRASALLFVKPSIYNFCN